MTPKAEEYAKRLDKFLMTFNENNAKLHDTDVQSLTLDFVKQFSEAYNQYSKLIRYNYYLIFLLAYGIAFYYAPWFIVVALGLFLINFYWIRARTAEVRKISMVYMDLCDTMITPDKPADHHTGGFVNDL